MTKLKTALITGASSGIGEQFTRLLSFEGYRIIMVARNENRMMEIASELDSEVKIITKDLSKHESVKELLKETENEEIDLLINNAGFGDYGLFSSLSEKKMDDMIALNIRALTDLCYGFISRMKKGSGIINIASMAAFSGGPYLAVYAATKAYVLSLSEALYEEYRDNVMVTALCPGPTETNFGSVSNMDKTILFRFTADSKSVAQYGLNALKNKRPVAIPGLSNKMLYIGSKLLPRAVSRGAIRLSRHLKQPDRR